MNPFSKPISELSFEDIQKSISAGVIESRHIEYKQTLPGGQDADRQEFLADVSAFANSSGGAILYGVEELEGKPISAPGIPINDPDSEILRLESIIRSGVDPRLPGLEFKLIQDQAVNPILVLFIPRSWHQPHVVTFKGSTKFYARGAAGKYPMDITEVRSSILSSEGLASRICQFHDTRCTEIRLGRSQIPVPQSGILVAHILPTHAFQIPQPLDVSFLEKERRFLLPLHGSIADARYNVDGYATIAQDSSGVIREYSQLSRDGVFETASVDIFSLNRDPAGIPSVLFEQEIAQFVANCLQIYSQENVDPPYSAFLSLLGVRGYIIVPSRERHASQAMERVYGRGIDRDDLRLPDVLIPSADPTRAPEFIKPWFDSVWRAAGWPGSQYYDEQGNWLLTIRT